MAHVRAGASWASAFAVANNIATRRKIRILMNKLRGRRYFDALLADELLESDSSDLWITPSDPPMVHSATTFQKSADSNPRRHAATPRRWYSWTSKSFSE